MSQPSLKSRFENAIARFLDGRPRVARSARLLHRFGKRNALRLSSLVRKVFSHGDIPQNIFHASVQRTGSRWIRAVFSDSRIREHTGLSVYPQHEYEICDFHHSFPSYTFVPGLYINYEQYIRIKKPKKYKTIYVIRDPRNVVLSWYKSMKDTHRNVNKSVSFFRNRLSPLKKEDGIEAAIHLYQVKLSYMRDWVQHADTDPYVMVVKMEDMTEYPVKAFMQIFDHCDIQIPRSVLESVMKDYDKSGMRRRNVKRREGKESDYGSSSTDWRKEFSDYHCKVFREVNGNLSELLGYDY